MDCSPPSSSVHGLFQARILEQVAISSSRGSSWPRDWTRVSCISSCIDRQILYHCAIWEAHDYLYWCSLFFRVYTNYSLVLPNFNLKNFCWDFFYKAEFLFSKAVFTSLPSFFSLFFKLHKISIDLSSSLFLPGEFHGQSLAGYSPWGRKEWTSLSN